jgi:transcriptional regulator with XRE-family HTH domain
MTRTKRLGTCPENAIIGAAVRKHRKAAWLTQEELAARLDCAPQRISYYEDGTAAMKGPVLIAVAQILGVPVGALLPNNAAVPYQLAQTRNKYNLTGQTFGWLTVTGPAAAPKTSRQRTWACVCRCGNKTDVLAGNLRSGRTASCGCWRKVARLNEGRAARNGGLKRPEAGLDPDWDSL